MKTVVVVPTYNEALNVQPLTEALLALQVPDHEIHVLVVDDHSPDGTWQIVEKMAQSNPHVHLLHRTTNRGRGLAGIEGFKWALKAGADRVVEMDADFSHHPKFVPDLLAALQAGAVVASGSGFVTGGSDEDRGASRQIITKMAGIYIRVLLDLPLKDASSGFRAYKRHVLEAIELDRFISTGPSIVQEVFFRSRQKGFIIKEVPISFLDRKLGETKLNVKTLFKVLGTVFQLRVLQIKGELFQNEPSRKSTQRA